MSQGAAIGIQSSRLEVTRCLFADNHASAYGGAIAATNNANVTVVNSTFIRNVASMGGAIYATTGTVLRINHTLFELNHVVEKSALNMALQGVGGAIYADDSLLVAVQCEFASNSADQAGGAVLISYTGPRSRLLNSLFFNNTAQFAGAVGVTDAAQVLISGARLMHNKAIMVGGAMAVRMGASAVLNSTLLEGNLAYNGAGGAVAYESGCFLEVIGSGFFENMAPMSGAIEATGPGSITNSIFARNVALGSMGGGVAVISSTLHVSGCRFEKNFAADNGGVFNMPVSNQGALRVRQSAFRHNRARSSGGAIAMAIGSLHVNGTAFLNNSAPSGGAMYLQLYGTSYAMLWDNLFQPLANGAENDIDMGYSDGSFTCRVGGQAPLPNITDYSGRGYTCVRAGQSVVSEWRRRLARCFLLSPCEY